MIRQIWFQNRQNIEKNRPQKTVGFPYYFTVSNIFTDNLKLI
jgi:hypothetical protein